ncbi:MAG: nucleotide exchange factor GrpE [Myxococcota bacterium]
MSNAADPQVHEGVEPVSIPVNDRRRFNEDGSPKEAPPETPPENSEVLRLQQELEAARKRIDELARGLQASERDREDFKRRVTRERENMLDIERGNVAVTLLEAIDQLDLALSTAEESPLKQGVRLIRENLLKKAESTGIEVVPLEGHEFDPNLAEATDMEVTANEAADNRVVAVTRSCYALKGRVIRPGQVKVARYVKPAQA